MNFQTLKLYLMFKTVFKVMSENQDYVDYLSSRLIELGNSVPNKIKKCMVNPIKESNKKPTFGLDSLPNEIFANPGDVIPNRVGFSKYASFLNSSYEQEHGRPLVLAMSADLAESTNLSGFAIEYGSNKNKGLYDKENNLKSPLFPQGITEFTNAGMMAGAATVNFSENGYEASISNTCRSHRRCECNFGRLRCGYAVWGDICGSVSISNNPDDVEHRIRN